LNDTEKVVMMDGGRTWEGKAGPIGKARLASEMGNARDERVALGGGEQEKAPNEEINRVASKNAGRVGISKEEVQMLNRQWARGERRKKNRRARGTGASEGKRAGVEKKGEGGSSACARHHRLKGAVSGVQT